MKLVTEGLDVLYSSIFRLENCLVSNIKIQKSFLSQLVSLQFLALFVKQLLDILRKLLSLVLVTHQKVCKLDYAVLLVLQGLGHLSQVFFPLFGEAACFLIDFHL